MKDHRERWQFYTHPSKPAITPEEVRYWKSTFEKVLKVGMEFEFNLQESKGQCKGDNVSCPCTHIEKSCWLECSNIQACKSIQNVDTCENANSKCSQIKCAACENYKFKCIGATCIDFNSVCFLCNKFEKDCNSCPEKWLPDQDPKHVRDKLSNELKPSRSYGKVSETGVVAITTDGSLLGKSVDNREKGGVEIITVGRRVDYWEFFKMSKRILDKVVNYGGYINERTSTHMHVLTAYIDGNSNELEKPVPEVIVANFHQLVRRYQNALTWLTIALDDTHHLTRWEKFRVSILGVSPVSRSMKAVAAEIHRLAGNKYGFVNYDNMRFNNEGHAERFHVEFRESDSTLCPSFYAALACLHYAFVVKAIEISRYGLLKVGDEEWLDEAQRMKEIILNGTGDYNGPRLGDTRYVLDHKDYFIQESRDMLGQMKNILIRIGPAYDVLSKIADEPVALRRVRGQSWEEIEKDIAIDISETGKLDLRIKEIIDLKLIDECHSLNEWIEAAHNLLAESGEEPEVGKEHIEKYINIKMKDGEAIWSDAIGCVLAI